MNIEDQEKGLNRLVSEAATVRALMTHPGMEFMKKRLEADAGKDYRKWALELNPAEAEKFRLRAQGYELFFAEVKEVLLRGEQAARQLANLDSLKRDERTIVDQPPA